VHIYQSLFCSVPRSSLAYTTSSGLLLRYNSSVRSLSTIWLNYFQLVTRLFFLAQSLGITAKTKYLEGHYFLLTSFFLTSVRASNISLDANYFSEEQKQLLINQSIRLVYVKFSRCVLLFVDFKNSFNKGLFYSVKRSFMA
jgi:hypothetical protein